MKNICTMKNALNAYQKARRCKRYRPEVLEFEANREEYLGKAIRELESLTYTPGKYKVFKVWEPKERIIMALPFYDRVIQHMIVNYIEPIFEHQFIYHSYACRKGKGAHRASKQLTRWLYNLEVVQGKSVYVLKADIHHYFQSIDHKVLKREIRTYIKDKDLLVILDRIIDHNGIFPDGVGIPVGNLTSQLFANVYLHRLDMFVKHTLHAEHYMRYMVDFVIISEDLEQLKRWEKQIEIFLADVLKLQLNPKTTIAKKVSVTSATVLKPGDILVTKSKGHTVIVVSVGGSAPSGSTSTSKPAVSGSTARVESARSKDAAIAGKYKTTSNLYLRVGAGTGKTAITLMPAGSSVQCYGYYTTYNGTRWYYVAYGDKTGFCSSAYLRKA